MRDNSGAIDDSSWEEYLEDHDFGIGKLVLQNYGIPNAAANFTPLVLRATVPSGVTVRFEFEEQGYTGDIQIWTKDINDPGRIDADVNEGGHRILPYMQYDVADLGGQGGVYTLYIAGIEEDPSIKTLNGVEQASKTKDEIRVRLGGDAYLLDDDLVQFAVTQPDSFLYKLQHDQPVRYGLAARSVYNPGSMPKFGLELQGKAELANLGVPGNVVGDLTGRSSVAGFTAGVYQNYLETGDNRFIQGFAGTDPTEIIDIITDLRQGLGLYTEQYAKAIEIGRSIAEAERIVSLATTGHSLGGGLASAASLAGDFPSQNFNSAGLHQNTIASIVNPASPQIDNYHVDIDLLTLTQSLPLIPDALGVFHELDGPYDDEVKAGQIAAILDAISTVLNLADVNWQAVLAKQLVLLGVEGAYAGLSHLMDAVLYGLLVDEQTGEDALGYDFTLNVEFPFGN